MTAFEPDRFHRALATTAIGRNFTYRPETSSTMDDARAAAAAGCPHGTLVLAEYQTSARGRRGRSFYAPDAENLYFTVVLFPEAAALRAMPLAVPLAVCEALCALGLNAAIKWPNDIWVDGRKLAGMLIDAASGTTPTVVFPGIGINVNGDPTVVPDLAAIATSAARELGAPVDRELLLAGICNRLEDALSHAFDDLLPRYRELSLVLGRDVEVISPASESFRATAIDVAPDGDLVVRLPSGELRSVIAADVSVRPA